MSSDICSIQTLKHFDDLSAMYDHIIKHKVKGDESSTVLIERYDFVGAWFKENKFTPIIEAITSIELLNRNGKPLSLAKYNLYCPASEDTFRGQHHTMEGLNTELYIAQEPSVVQDVRAPITSYFVKEKTQESAGPSKATATKGVSRKSDGKSTVSGKSESK